jgi:Xaa-Pro aminopeptidase
MIWPGSIPPRLRAIQKIVRAAHDRAIAVIEPGVKASTVDRAARDHIRKAGFGPRFGHGLGHGIGLNVHESPRLGRNSDDLLKTGMVVTIEPGIYLPGVGGVRIEDDVLVTETGHEVLSSLPT